MQQLFQRLKMTVINVCNRINDWVNDGVSPQRAEQARRLGAISLLVCSFSLCCGFSSILCLIASIYGLTKNKRDILCIAGTVIGAAVLIYTIISTIQLANDPQWLSAMEGYVDSFAGSVSGSDVG